MKLKQLLGVFSLGSLYSSMYLLLYIKFIFYDGLLAATGLNNTQIGSAISAFIGVAIFTTIISGYFADRYSIKKMVIGSGIVHALVVFSYPFVMKSYAMTLVVWAVMGFTSVICFWAPVYKGVRMLGAENLQGKLFGFFEAATGFFSMVVNFIALWIYGLYADPAAALTNVVYFYAGFGLFATVLVFFFYHPQVEQVTSATHNNENKVPLSELLTLLKMPRIWALSIAVFGIFAFFIGSTMLTPYFSSVLGVTIVFSGFLATLKTHGAKLIAAPVFGIVADKFSTLTTLVYGFIIMIVLMIVFLMLPGTPAVIVPLTILMFMLALVNLGMKGIMLSATDEIGVSPRVAGTAIAIVSTIGFNVPDLVVHPFFGWLLDTYEPVAAYTMIFATLIGFCVIGLLATIFILFANKKSRNTVQMEKELSTTI